MINLQEFIDKWNGKQCEVAGSTNAKFQCVDLVNAYIRDVLGLPIIEWTNAKDFPKKCSPDNYEYILNTSKGFPLKGDIIIWKSLDGIGHIAICIEDGNTINFKSFDQNWSKPLYCTIETHIYIGTNQQVIGWLRPKNVIIKEDMTDEQKRILEFLNGKTEGDVREAFGALTDLQNKNKQIEIFFKEIETLKANIDSLNSKYAELEAKFVENKKLVEKQQKELSTANDEISKLNETISNITEEKNTWQSRYNNKNSEYNELLEKYNQVQPNTKFNLLDFIKNLFNK